MIEKFGRRQDESWPEDEGQQVLNHGRESFGFFPGADHQCDCVFGLLPNAMHTVGIELAVGTDDGKSLNESLRDQQPIERVTMMER